jgi:hypothetical protein
LVRSSKERPALEQALVKVLVQALMEKTVVPMGLKI